MLVQLKSTPTLPVYRQAGFLKGGRRLQNDRENVRLEVRLAVNFIGLKRI